jgi:hypothetical protein
VTAINTIRQSHAVHVMADGASFSPQGRPAYPCPSSKIWPLPHLNAVVAGRGPKLLPPMIADVLGSSAENYAQLKAIAPDVLKAFLPQMSDILGARGAQDLACDLVIAGISETSGPDAFLICNHPGHVTLGLAPWTLVDLPTITMMPLDDAGQQELDEMLAGRNLEDLDPVVDGIRMMEIQRAMNLSFSIGGFVHLVTVEAGSIVSRIIHRWSEPAGRGKPLQPSYPNLTGEMK